MAIYKHITALRFFGEMFHPYYQMLQPPSSRAAGLEAAWRSRCCRQGDGVVAESIPHQMRGFSQCWGIGGILFATELLCTASHPRPSVAEPRFFIATDSRGWNTDEISTALVGQYHTGIPAVQISCSPQDASCV